MKNNKNKRDVWLDKKNRVNKSDEFEDFSFPVFLIKLFTVLNFILIFVIILDFILTPVSKPAELSLYAKYKAELKYDNYDYQNLSVDKRFKESIGEKSSVTVYFTPIFEYRKYFSGKDLKGNIYKKNSYEVLLPIFTGFINAFAFIIIILFPAFNDKILNSSETSVTTVLSPARESLPEFAETVFLLPFVLSAIHWYDLYYYFF